jgi:hypothetical protein
MDYLLPTATETPNWELVARASVGPFRASFAFDVPFVERAGDELETPAPAAAP